MWEVSWRRGQTAHILTQSSSRDHSSTSSSGLLNRGSLRVQTSVWSWFSLRGQLRLELNCNSNSNWLKPSVAPGYIIVCRPPASCGRTYLHRIQPRPRVKVIPRYLRPDASVIYTGASLNKQLGRGPICYSSSVSKSAQFSLSHFSIFKLISIVLGSGLQFGPSVSKLSQPLLNIQADLYRAGVWTIIWSECQQIISATSQYSSWPLSCWGLDYNLVRVSANYLSHFSIFKLTSLVLGSGLQFGPSVSKLSQPLLNIQVDIYRAWVETTIWSDCHQITWVLSVLYASWYLSCCGMDYDFVQVSVNHLNSLSHFSIF